MATLMLTGTGNGETGRCDAKCYNAKSPECKCCCGGRNHGAGLEQAVKNVNEHWEQMTRDYERGHPGEFFQVNPMLF